MKKLRSIASIADLIVLVLIVVLNPLSPLQPSYRLNPPPHIPDKIIIRYYQDVKPDSLLSERLEAELDEMRYYLRVHNVADEGYQYVAQYHTQLLQKARMAKASRLTKDSKISRVSRDTIPARLRPMVAVKAMGGYWKAGHFYLGKLNGKGIARDRQSRIVSAVWSADTVVYGMRNDEQGCYEGQMDSLLQACGQGMMDEWDGCHKEGYWLGDKMHGFGFDSSPHHQLHVGEWKAGKFLGEKLKYTAERIYGIDISRHQHEKGRHRYGINWSQLRITSLGKRHDAQGRTFPVSFVYIKSTEGTTIRNRYFMQDYMKAKKHGIHVGAYHFFSMKTSAEAQANYFLNHTLFRKGDFPPVLDVEPTDAQIRQIGGDNELMRRIRIFMRMVEKRTGMRPILYISQMFINKHMANAEDIKKNYNVWIARYGQYKPDVRLVYWQLCPDGRVNGITGEVDVNVFNGYQNQFNEFTRTGFHK